MRIWPSVAAMLRAQRARIDDRDKGCLGNASTRTCTSCISSLRHRSMLLRPRSNILLAMAASRPALSGANEEEEDGWKEEFRVAPPCERRGP